MTGPTPLVRYPAGPLTPHGAYHILKGRIPSLWLTSFDETVHIDLMGGASIIDHTRPESVHIKKNGLKGLIAPWKIIQQKGATQDGVTFVTSLGEATEVTINAVARARDGEHLRRVIDHLTGSLHPKKTSRLHFWTNSMGHWWADMRWMKTLPGAMSGAQQRFQAVDLMLQADDGYWRTKPDVDMFEFAYESMVETFGTNTATDLGPNWPLYYYGGSGGGYPHASGGEAKWVDDPDDPITTQGRSVMFGPYKNFQTDTNNQVVTIELGSFQEFTFPDGAEDHIWLRVGRNVDGTWNGSGVRVSIGPFSVELSRFNNFVEATMAVWPNLPSFPGEKYTAIAGFDGNERRFQVQRNGLPIWNHTEKAGGPSPLGAANRGISAGMRAGGALITQSTPASIRKITAGDNALVDQEGFLERVNIGDQDMYDDLTLFGPAKKVKVYNGPGSEDWVEFGPILPNQVMFLRTDPEDRTVQDLTTVPPTPQELNLFQSALDKLFDVVGISGTPFGQQIESQFGIRAPQGNVYSLLTGRFSTAAAIPPKSPGKPAQPYHVKVVVEGGNAATKIIAAGTPRRRLPF
jgi:hypothetical protein